MPPTNRSRPIFANNSHFTDRESLGISRLEYRERDCHSRMGSMGRGAANRDGGKSMKRFRVWGYSAALVAGLGGPVAAGDFLAPPPDRPSLAKKLFGPSGPKPAGPTVRSGAPTSQRPLTISAPISADVLADALRNEQDAYLRRVSVCTELRRVAMERADDALARQADELERQAAALYNARVASLGVSRVKAALPDPTPASVLSLEEPAGVRTAANRLVAPASPVPNSSTAGIREVKP